MNENEKSIEAKAGRRLAIAISRVLTHASIVLAGALLTLFIIDRASAGEMGFLANPLSKWMLMLLCCLTLVNAVSHLDSLRKLTIIRKYEKLRRRENNDER